MHREFDGWSYSAIFAPENEPTFGLSYYLEGGSAPDLAEVVIEGESHDLGLTYDVENRGTYETTLILDPGCHRYYFRLIDSNGDEHLYPTTGTLGAGVQSDCALYQTP